MNEKPRRGRPPLPPELRRPRKSGPSGEHTVLTSAELEERDMLFLRARLALREPKATALQLVTAARAAGFGVPLGLGRGAGRGRTGLPALRAWVASLEG